MKLKSGNKKNVARCHCGLWTRKFSMIPCMMVIVGMLVLLSPAVAQDVTLKTESLEDYNSRMEWFAEAKYGMFIHFGLYSQLGGVWKEKKVKGYAEWIQSKAKIPRDEYAQLLKTFNPSKFDADFIVSTAKQAGMTYLVITAKHHEGFCLWDSKFTEFDVASTPFKGRDILDELNTACKKHGIKFGLYYSILDWHHPAQTGLGFHNKMVKGRKQDYVDYQKNQVLELIEKYDPSAATWTVYSGHGDWARWWTMADGIDLYNTIRTASSKVIPTIASPNEGNLSWTTSPRNRSISRALSPNTGRVVTR